MSPFICVANAEGQGTQSINVEFVQEPGCPIEVQSARADLEMDAFGIPVAAKTYIDYKNVGSGPIAAVKFRVRFCDEQGSDKGTFHADDAQVIAPGTTGSGKWRTQKLGPKVSQAKLRVLMVKPSDGPAWESQKWPEILHPKPRNLIEQGLSGGEDQGAMDLQAGGSASSQPANQPVIDQPVVNQPATDQPKSDQPASDPFSANQPAANQAASDKPTSDQSAANQSSSDKSSSDKSSSDKSSSDKPSTDKPSTDKPASDKPSSDQPAALQAQPSQSQIAAPATTEGKSAQPQGATDAFGRALARPSQ